MSIHGFRSLFEAEFDGEDVMCASLGREISSQKLHSACLPTAFFCNVQTGNARGLRVKNVAIFIS